MYVLRTEYLDLAAAAVQCSAVQRSAAQRRTRAIEAGAGATNVVFFRPSLSLLLLLDLQSMCVWLVAHENATLPTNLQQGIFHYS